MRITERSTETISRRLFQADLYPTLSDSHYRAPTRQTEKETIDPTSVEFPSHPVRTHAIFTTKSTIMRQVTAKASQPPRVFYSIQPTLTPI